MSNDAMAACEKLQVFADGELPMDEVPAFERHFAECTGCQTELQDILLLESLAQEIHPPLVLPALEGAPPFSPRRSRRASLALGSMPCCTTVQAPPRVTKKPCKYSSKPSCTAAESTFATRRLVRASPSPSAPVRSATASSSSGVFRE